MEYSRKIAQHDNVELFWNMEYSRKILQQAKLSFWIWWNLVEPVELVKLCKNSEPAGTNWNLV